MGERGDAEYDERRGVTAVHIFIVRRFAGYVRQSTRFYRAGGLNLSLGGGGLSKAGVARIKAAYNLPDRCIEGGVFTAWQVVPYVEDPRRAELMRAHLARQAGGGEGNRGETRATATRQRPAR